MEDLRQTGIYTLCFKLTVGVFDMDFLNPCITITDIGLCKMTNSSDGSFHEHVYSPKRQKNRKINTMRIQNTDNCRAF